MQGSAPGTGRRGRIQALTLTALMTAVSCVLAPFSLSIGPVPISLTNLVIFFSVYLLGWKRADNKVRIPLYGPQYVFVPKGCSK